MRSFDHRMHRFGISGGKTLWRIVCWQLDGWFTCRTAIKPMWCVYVYVVWPAMRWWSSNRQHSSLRQLNNHRITIRRRVWHLSQRLLVQSTPHQPCRLFSTLCIVISYVTSFDLYHQFKIQLTECSIGCNTVELSKSTVRMLLLSAF